MDQHKGSYDCENNHSYQSKPLLDYNEKQCYNKDMERTVVAKSEMHEVPQSRGAPNTNANWSLNRSISDRSDRLLSCIILTSQTLLVITGVQTLKMMLHFFLKYRILFCHKDLVSTPLFCQQLSKCGKLEIYLPLMKLASHGNCHLCKFQSCPDFQANHGKLFMRSFQGSHSNWKWEDIFQCGNFKQTGKVRDNHTKYWKVREFRTNFIIFK